ncbi:ArsR family transcriptional regulator [bacterium]|nr:ArsR family transcriptional regulator [Parcubacteria group bacterium]MBF05265.1 ArsR family transcriptional regulator [bacterium]
MVTLHTFCRAFGNAERVRLVVCLSRTATVSELLEKCHLSQSALSQHLAILRNAGVITAHRNGRYVQYKTCSRAYVQLAKTIINLTQ